MLLTDFFNSNAGSATGASRGNEDLLFLPLILGHVTLGALLAIILGRWANISTFSSGAMAGAVIGGLMTATNALIMYATTYMTTMTGTIVNIIVSTVISALAGGAIACTTGIAKNNFHF